MCSAAVAVKENQTSLLGVPVTSSVCAEAVAPVVVPEVTEVHSRFELTVREIAPSQSSLAGGATASAPEQSSSIPLPGISVAPGLIAALVSSQSSGTK